VFNDQRRAPLFEALKKHTVKNPACFHIPGHGQGKGLPFELSSQGGQALFRLDLTELPGLDDLHNPAGPIAEAQVWPQKFTVLTVLFSCYAYGGIQP
jgi:arginine/lysine/ornithine decarboxylase